MASYPPPQNETGVFNSNDFPTSSDKLSGFSTNKILVSNSSGSITASEISSTKITFLANVTADINTSLNSKQNTITSNSLNITDTNGLESALDSKQAIISDGDLTIAKTNGLQTALDSKQATISDGDLSIAKTSGLQDALNAKQATISDGDLTIAKTNDLQTALDAKLSIDSGSKNTSGGTSSEIINVGQVRIHNNNGVYGIGTKNSQLAIFGGNQNGIGFYTAESNDGNDTMMVDSSVAAGDEILRITNNGLVQIRDNNVNGITKKLTIGTSNDTQIFHGASGFIDGTTTNESDTTEQSYIRHSGTNHLRLVTTGTSSNSKNVQMKANDGRETMANFMSGAEVQLFHAGTQKFQTTSTGIKVFGSTVNTSDARTKENIVDADTTNLMTDFLNVRFCNFNELNSDDTRIGVIAQEIINIFPNLVTEEENHTGETKILSNDEETGEEINEMIVDENMPTIFSVNYQELHTLSCIIVQELIKENTELKNLLNTLETRVSVLENLV